MYFYLFKDVQGQWRWNLNSTNHKIIATGAEGYHNKIDCLNGIRLVKAGASAAKILDSETSTYVM